MNKISIAVQERIRICFENSNKADIELERFANLLKRLIEKYIDKIDLDSLPDPPRPTIDKVVGFLLS